MSIKYRHIGVKITRSSMGAFVLTNFHSFVAGWITAKAGFFFRKLLRSILSSLPEIQSGDCKPFNGFWRRYLSKYVSPVPQTRADTQIAQNRVSRRNSSNDFPLSHPAAVIAGAIINRDYLPYSVDVCFVFPCLGFGIIDGEKEKELRDGG